jgi:hypothetical protein
VTGAYLHAFVFYDSEFPGLDFHIFRLDDVLLEAYFCGLLRIGENLLNAGNALDYALD